MIKKTKLIISALSAVAIVSIVPIVAVACGATTTNNTTTSNASKVQANITALQNIKISANANATKTATEVAKLLLPNSPNLNALENFFNIKAIENAATANEVQATYSVVSPVSTTTINANISDATEDNTLIISVKLSLGTGTDAVSQSQNVTITNFPNNNQATINTYINSINTLTGDKVITGKSINIPSTITNANFNTYLNNVPTVPSGITLSFNLSEPNLTAGTVNITITATNGAASLTSNVIKVKGFLSMGQINIDTYIEKINSLPPNTITGNNAFLITDLTNENIGANLNNVPDSTGLVLTYAISKKEVDTGTLSITISAAIAGSSAIVKTSNLISVSGFLSTDQNTINTYIDQINKLSPNTIVGKNTVLASELDDLSIRIYLSNMPDTPAGVTRSFTISSPNDNNGTINIIVSASIDGATTVSSKLITVNGFSTAQEWLDTNISDFPTTYTAVAQSAVSPTSAYNTLNAKANSLNIADFSPYFDIASINKFLINWNFTINSIKLITPDTSNIANGTLNFILNFSFNKIIKPVIVTLSDFQKTTVSTNQNTNLTKLQNIATKLGELSIEVNTRESSLSAKEAYDEITTLRDLTLEKLNSYFSIDAINALLATDGASNTVSLINYNQINGTVTFEISLSLGTEADKAELNNILFTITGFHVEINLSGVVAPNSIFANYWSDPEVTNTLGHTSSETSLYFPDNSGADKFNSSAVIAQFGDGPLPSFITNINFPSDFVQSDIESWMVTGHNPTGIAVYLITLKTNKTAVLTVTGFMNDKRITNLKLINVEKAADIGTLPTPSNNAPITKDGITSGVTAINLGTLNMNFFGGGISSYTIANSDPANGSINIIITFKSGLIISLPVTGYLKVTA